jgi:hypothetical protein
MMSVSLWIAVRWRAMMSNPEKKKQNWATAAHLTTPLQGTTPADIGDPTVANLQFAIRGEKHACDHALSEQRRSCLLLPLAQKIVVGKL